MSNNPLVSVVIPVYNGNNYLRDAIDSVLNQTYTSYEIIVVDDGSTDDTWDIIQSYGDKVRGFHKENGGVSTALNYAIDIMQGEWFAWLSHDDLWLPEMLESQIKWMKNNPDFMLYYSGYYAMNSKMEIIAEYHGYNYTRGKDLRVLIRDNYIHGITVLINKECFKSVGLFCKKYKCVQDYDMWCRIAKKYPISGQNKPLSINRIHPNQTANVSHNHCNNENKFIKLKMINNIDISILYPKLQDSQISLLNKYIIYIRCATFRKYNSICVRLNIPRIIRIYEYLLRKIRKTNMSYSSH